MHPLDVLTSPLRYLAVAAGWIDTQLTKELRAQIDEAKAQLADQLHGEEDHITIARATR